MNTQKPKKEVKFPAKAIPMARLQKWQGVVKEAQELEKQILEAQKVLDGKKAVAEFLAKDLATEFNVGPKDQVNMETGEITREK